MKRIDKTNIAIGARIKEMRIKRHMTQEMFAEKADICSGQHVSNIERGINGVSVSKLMDICEVLDVEADYLLFGKNASDLTNEEEKEIIIAYSNAVPAIQEAVRKLLDVTNKTEKSSDLKIG